MCAGFGLTAALFTTSLGVPRFGEGEGVFLGRAASAPHGPFRIDSAPRALPVQSPLYEIDLGLLLPFGEPSQFQLTWGSVESPLAQHSLLFGLWPLPAIAEREALVSAMFLLLSWAGEGRCSPKGAPSKSKKLESASRAATCLAEILKLHHQCDKPASFVVTTETRRLLVKGVVGAQPGWPVWSLTGGETPGGERSEPRLPFRGCVFYSIRSRKVESSSW